MSPIVSTKYSGAPLRQSPDGRDGRRAAQYSEQFANDDFFGTRSHQRFARSHQRFRESKGVQICTDRVSYFGRGPSPEAPDPRSAGSLCLRIEPGHRSLHVAIWNQTVLSLRCDAQQTHARDTIARSSRCRRDLAEIVAMWQCVISVAPVHRQRHRVERSTPT